MNLKLRIKYLIRSEFIKNFLSRISVKSIDCVDCGFDLLLVLVDC